MYCINCGKQIDDNASFCPFCGTQLRNSPPQQPNGYNNYYPQNNNQPVNYQQNDINNYAQNNNYNPNNYYPPNNGYIDNSNPIAIVGFVFSFFIAIVGLICSIIGYNRAKDENAKYGELAYAGIIISIVSMVLALISVLIVFVVVVTEI